MGEDDKKLHIRHNGTVTNLKWHQFFAASEVIRR